MEECYFYMGVIHVFWIVQMVLCRAKYHIFVKIKRKILIHFQKLEYS